MITDEQQILIDKYLQGTLTDREQEELVALREDSAFQEELAFQSDLQQAVQGRYREAFQIKIEQLKRESMEAYRTDPKAAPETTDATEKLIRQEGKTIPWRRIFAIAAAIAIVVIAGIFFWQTPGTDSIFIEHVALAGSSRGADTEVAQALTAYDQQDYQQAKQLFSEIPDDEKGDEELFYNAITLLRLNQQESHPEDVTQAVQYLEMLSQGSGNYQEIAEWHLALALLVQGNENQAKVILDEIAQNPHPYSEQAREKLRQL